jgi:hypothetical protein
MMGFIQSQEGTEAKCTSTREREREKKSANNMTTYDYRNFFLVQK